MFSSKKLVIFNVTIDNVNDVYNYFTSLEIGEIKTIKFIKNKNSINGNIHIRLKKWYNNNISYNFYNNLCDQIRITKMVYNDPEYFEIEFDEFSHEYFINNKKNKNYIYKKFIYNNSKTLLKNILTKYMRNTIFKKINSDKNCKIRLLKRISNLNK